MGLLPPLNGQISYSQGSPFGPFPQGTMATLQCSPGFGAQGQQTATCQNGQFQPSSLGPCVQGGGTGWPGGAGSKNFIKCFKNSKEKKCHKKYEPKTLH